MINHQFMEKWKVLKKKCQPHPHQQIPDIEASCGLQSFYKTLSLQNLVPSDFNVSTALQ